MYFTNFLFPKENLGVLDAHPTKTRVVRTMNLFEGLNFLLQQKNMFLYKNLNMAFEKFFSCKYDKIIHSVVLALFYISTKLSKTFIKFMGCVKTDISARVLIAKTYVNIFTILKTLLVIQNEDCTHNNLILRRFS